MTAGDDGANKATQTAVWCGKCGIPYAAGTVYCANCGTELAPLEAVSGPFTPAPARPAMPTTRNLAPAAPREPLIGTTITSGVVSPLAARLQEQSAPMAGSTAPGTPILLDSSAPTMPTLDEAFPNPPRGLLDRVRQRQQTMSDLEVDAAAAAIIAQARTIEADAPGQRDALALLADFAPDPAVEAALQKRRERDRAWLIGGVICCVLLIVFALAISRYMSVGLLRH